MGGMIAGIIGIILIGVAGTALIKFAALVIGTIGIWWSVTLLIAVVVVIAIFVWLFLLLPRNIQLGLGAFFGLWSGLLIIGIMFVMIWDAVINNNTLWQQSALYLYWGRLLIITGMVSLVPVCLVARNELKHD